MARQRFEPARGTRGSSGYLYYELSLAQGPAAIGVTGQNRLVDFIGYAWLLLVDLNRELHLFRQTATVGQWEEVTASLPPVFAAPLPVGARRVSFAFDQSARINVVYELDNEVFLTRWDAVTSEYVQNVAVAGVDPFVIFDAVWYQSVPDSDVLLFYLSADRQRVLCRVQREIYSVERVIHDYGTPVVLDRVIRIPLRYEVLLSDATGEPLEVAGERVALISDPYPYLGGSTLDMTSIALGDTVQAEVVRVFHEDDEVIAATVSLSGTLTAESLVIAYVDEEDQRVAASVAAGSTVVAESVRFGIEGGDEALVTTVVLSPAVEAILVRVFRVEEDGPLVTGLALGGVIRAETA